MAAGWVELTIRDGGGTERTISVFSDDGTIDGGLSAAHVVFKPGHYDPVLAGTTEALGATGAVGDYLEGVLVIPATTSPGAVTLFDGPATSPDLGITIFTGGTVSDIKSFFLPLGMFSTVGAWQLRTGSNVSAVAIGKFT